MNETWKANVLLLLDEAYVQPEYKQTWFKDNSPDSSLIPSLRRLDAEVAARQPACGLHPAAGHAHHLAASLEGAISAYKGGPYHVDWEASWTFPQPLTDAVWAELLQRLEAAYTELRSVIAANEDWEDPIRSLSVLALLSHAAFHLGAIRQIAADHLPQTTTES